MLKKEFVPHEQSLALKELGFNEPCFGYYDEGGNLYTEMVEVLKAPLYQQAFRFFREKYNLHYPIQIQGNLWFFEKWSLNGFKTYEEAELACLNKLIEIVKNK